MHRAQYMMETGVQGTGVDKVRHSQLPDSSQPLHVRVFDEIKNEIVWYGNKPINRVVEDLFFVLILHSYVALIVLKQTKIAILLMGNAFILTSTFRRERSYVSVR